MSSVPHECPPAGRRCFDCNPRSLSVLPTLHAAIADLPSWATQRHGAAVDELRSAVAQTTHRLAETLTALGVERGVARALAPELAASVMAAIDVEGDATLVLDAFVDRLQRGTR